METVSLACPTAAQFRLAFTTAFRECLPRSSKGKKFAYQNRTAFMTGKENWKGRAVLAEVRRKLSHKFKLKNEYEYLRVDMTLYHPGEQWGNFVMVEHENVIRGFGEEIEKLMSVLAPLKVGITYGNADEEDGLLKEIQTHFETRHRAIMENRRAEYLFLLSPRSWETEQVRWKYLAFTAKEGPGRRQFRAVCSPQTEACREEILRCRHR